MRVALVDSGTEMAAHIVLIEPQGSLRDLMRPRLGALGEGLGIVGTLEEAQARVGFGELAIVIARGRGDPGLAAELACAFDVGADAARLIVLETGSAPLPAGRAASAYLHEVDRTLACMRSCPPVPEAVDAWLELAPDFPCDTYKALARVGEVACGHVYLVRNHATGLKELLVQTRDDHVDAPQVAQALYRNFAGRGRPWVDVLRHEVTRHHSFISSATLPFDLARQAELAA